ncbi:MAG: hypothetical protein JST54_25505 [Deltaproteobacteria bacterium]|nr:hypothetical protein [Deltaproteobacteria bacterium]
MRTHNTTTALQIFIAALTANALLACGPGRVIPAVQPGATTDAGSTHGSSTTGSTSAGGAPHIDAGSAVDAGESTYPTQGDSDAGTVVDGGTPVTPPTEYDAGPPQVIDAGSTEVVDAGSPVTPPVEVDAGAVTTTPSNPSFAAWAWSTPDVNAVVHAGFNWFESGYPGTLSATDNQYLSDHGTVPFAYINMSEVPNDDSFLQGQIGSFWSSISLCANTSWNTTVVDVRDARWQDWLIRRANDAYSLGNRGIKWDVAGVESLCNSWSGAGGATAQQQAIAAMASVLATLKSQHPDFRFIVNQGFGIQAAHPELIDAFELENMINYLDANPGDQWANDMIAQVSAIHESAHIPILNLEYYDLFGCSDTTCSLANQIYNQVVALDWVPYITVVDMNVQGHGLGITPPW